jgi:hypothetical protein
VSCSTLRQLQVTGGFRVSKVILVTTLCLVLNGARAIAQSTQDDPKASDLSRSLTCVDLSIEAAPKKEDGKTSVLTQGSCTYVLKHQTFSFISQRIAETVFGGFAPTTTEERYFREKGTGTNTVVYWHSDPLVRGQIERALSLYDRLESFSRRPIVEIQVQAYLTTSEAERRFSASLKSMVVGGPTSGLGESLIDTSSGVESALTVGTVALSGLLRASRAKREIIDASGHTFQSNNLEPIDSGVTKPLLRHFSGMPNPIKYEAGIEISGTPSINAEDNEFVILKNAGISYGIEAEGVERLDKHIHIKRSTIQLESGTSLVLVGEAHSMSAKESGSGIISINRGKSEELSRLVFIISTRVVNYNQLSKELHFKNRGSPDRKFTKEELEKLPVSNGKVDEGFLELMGSMEPYSINVDNGDTLLAFKLDSTLASRRNIKRQILVRVKSQALEVNKMLSVENIVLSDFELGIVNLGTLKLRGGVIKMDVHLEEKFPLDGKKRSVKIPVFYNTANSYFCRRDRPCL